MDSVLKHGDEDMPPFLKSAPSRAATTGENATGGYPGRAADALPQQSGSADEEQIPSRASSASSQHGSADGAADAQAVFVHGESDVDSDAPPGLAAALSRRPQTTLASPAHTTAGRTDAEQNDADAQLPHPNHSDASLVAARTQAASTAPAGAQVSDRVHTSSSDAPSMQLEMLAVTTVTTTTTTTDTTLNSPTAATTMELRRTSAHVTRGSTHSRNSPHWRQMQRSADGSSGPGPVWRVAVPASSLSLQESMLAQTASDEDITTSSPASVRPSSHSDRHGRSASTQLSPRFSSPATHAFTIELGMAQTERHHEEPESESMSATAGASLEAPLNAIHAQSTSAVNSLQFYDESFLTPSQAPLMMIGSQASGDVSHGSLAQPQSASDMLGTDAPPLSALGRRPPALLLAGRVRAVTAQPPMLHSPSPDEKTDEATHAPPSSAMRMRTTTAEGSVTADFARASAASTASPLLASPPSHPSQTSPTALPTVSAIGAADTVLALEEANSSVGTRSNSTINSGPAPPSLLSTERLTMGGDEDMSQSGVQSDSLTRRHLALEPVVSLQSSDVPGAPEPLTGLTLESLQVERRRDSPGSASLLSPTPCPVKTAVDVAVAAKLSKPHCFAPHAVHTGSSARSDGSIDTVLARLYGLVPPQTVSGDARGTGHIEEAAALTAAAAVLATPRAPRAMHGFIRPLQRTDTSPHSAELSSGAPAALGALAVTTPSDLAELATRRADRPTLALTPDTGGNSTRGERPLHNQQDSRAIHALVHGDAPLSVHALGEPVRPGSHSGARRDNMRASTERELPAAAATTTPFTHPGEGNSALSAESAADRSGEPRTADVPAPREPWYSRAWLHGRAMPHLFLRPYLRWLLIPFMVALLVLAFGILTAIVMTSHHFVLGELTNIHSHLHAKMRTVFIRNGALSSMVPDFAAMVLEAVSPALESTEAVAQRLCRTAARQSASGYPIGISYVSGVPTEPLVYCAPFVLSSEEGPSGLNGRSAPRSEYVFVRLVRDANTGLYNGLYTVDETTFELTSPPRLVELFPGRRPYTETEVLAWLGLQPHDVPRTQSLLLNGTLCTDCDNPSQHAGDSGCGTDTRLSGLHIAAGDTECGGELLPRSLRESTGQWRRVRVSRSDVGNRYDVVYTRRLVERLHPARRRPLGDAGEQVLSHVSSHVPVQQLLQNAEVALFNARAIRGGGLGADTVHAATKMAGVIVMDVVPHDAADDGELYGALVPWGGANVSFHIFAQVWVMDAARGIFSGEPFHRTGPNTPSPAHLLPFRVSLDRLDTYVASTRMPLLLQRHVKDGWTGSHTSGEDDGTELPTPLPLMARENRNRRLKGERPFKHTVYWRSHKYIHSTVLASTAARVTLADEFSPKRNSSDSRQSVCAIIATPATLIDRGMRREVLRIAILSVTVATVLFLVSLVSDVVLLLVRRPVLHAIHNIENACTLIDRPWMALPPVSEQGSAIPPEPTGDRSNSAAATPDDGCSPSSRWILPLVRRVKVAESVRVSELCVSMYNRTDVIRQFLPEYFFPPTSRNGADKRSRVAPQNTPLFFHRPSASPQPDLTVGAVSSGRGADGDGVTPSYEGINTALTGAAAAPDVSPEEGDSPLSRSLAGCSPRRRPALPVLTTVEVPAALRVVSRPGVRPPSVALTDDDVAASQRRTGLLASIQPLQAPRTLTATLPVVLQTHAGTLSEFSLLHRTASPSDVETRPLPATDNKASWYAQCFCSTISIHHELVSDGDLASPDMGHFMELVVDMVDKFDVNMDILSPEMLTLSVGSRTIVKDHALIATRCALELFKGTPRSILQNTTMVVDSGVFNYGVCGVPQHRGFVMWGRPSAELFFEQQKINHLPFLLTDTVAPLVQGYYRVLPIDGVQIVQESNSPHIVLYALYEGSPTSSAWTYLAPRYIEAFHAAMDRRYAHAVEQLEPLLDSPLFPRNGTFLYAIALQHSLLLRVRRRELSNVEADSLFRQGLHRVLQMLQTRNMPFPLGQESLLQDRAVTLSWKIPNSTIFLSPQALAECKEAAKADSTRPTKQSIELWSESRHSSSPSTSSMTDGSGTRGDESRWSARSPISATGSLRSTKSSGGKVNARTSPSVEPPLPLVPPSEIVYVFDPLTNTSTFRSIHDTQGEKPAVEASNSQPHDDGHAIETRKPQSFLFAATADMSGVLGTHRSAASAALTPSLPAPNGQGDEGATVASWLPLPLSVTDLNGNVWRRGKEPYRPTVCDLWTRNFRGMSANGAMVDLNVCRFSEAGRMPSSADGASTEASEAFSGAVSQESLKYMEIVCEAFYHENIHQLLSVAVLPDLPYLCFICEYEPGETVQTLIERYDRALPRALIYSCCAAMLRGLDFLHTDKGTIHGLLCPGHVLMGTEGGWKLQGMMYLFGWATAAATDLDRLIHDFEVPYYLSPEVLLGEPKSAASDMYAFGLILLAMLVGGEPWTWSGFNFGPLPRRSKEELLAVLQNRRLFTQTLLSGDLALCSYGPHMNTYNSTLQQACNERTAAAVQSDDKTVPGAFALAKDADTDSLKTDITITSNTPQAPLSGYDEVLLAVLEACLPFNPADRKSAAAVLHILESSSAYRE